MKYSVVICLATIILFYSGCKKDLAGSVSVAGTWELRHAQNGMIPTIDYAPGNGNMLIFSESGYEKYETGNLVKSGHYKVVQDGSAEAELGLVIPSGQFTNRIILDNDFTSPKIFFEVSNNNLTLLSGYFPLDGGSSLSYGRIKGNR
jgi:hypothetical protein